MRAESLDADQQHCNIRSGKLAKISRLFRTKTESSENVVSTAPKSPSKVDRQPSSAPVRPASPFRSMSPSPVSPRTKRSPGSRRFVRVVRDEEVADQDYDNPHVVLKYSSDYWSRQQQSSITSCGNDSISKGKTGKALLPKSPSLDVAKFSSSPLLIVISAQQQSKQTPILKKRSRSAGEVRSGSRRTEKGGCEGGASSITEVDDVGRTGSTIELGRSKRATFNEQVQIIEFSNKGRMQRCILGMHSGQLQRSEGLEIAGGVTNDGTAATGRASTTSSSSESSDSGAEANLSRDSSLGDSISDNPRVDMRASIMTEV